MRKFLLFILSVFILIINIDIAKSDDVRNYIKVTEHDGTPYGRLPPVNVSKYNWVNSNFQNLDISTKNLTVVAGNTNYIELSESTQTKTGGLNLGGRLNSHDISSSTSNAVGVTYLSLRGAYDSLPTSGYEIGNIIFNIDDKCLYISTEVVIGVESWSKIGSQ